MDNTAILTPDNFDQKPSPKPPAGQVPPQPESDHNEPVFSGVNDYHTLSSADTEELPRAESAARRTAHRSRIPFLQLLAVLAGGAAGAYFALNLPAGADLSGSLLCRSGDFGAMLLRRLAWDGAFLLAEYLCGYFALGWLLVWAVPLVCGLGTGAALAGAFAAGTNAAPLIIPAAGTAIAASLAAGTSRNMSAQLMDLVTSPCGVVSDSPAAGDYTLKFLAWGGVMTALALIECAVRCLTTA